MSWYVLRTSTGQEEKISLLLQVIFRELEFIFPKRRLSWRKKGQIIDVIKPLFRGYLFVSATDKYIKKLDVWLRVNGLEAWLMKIEKTITPINSEEVSLIKKIMSNGDVVEESQIMKIGEKVNIVNGPLVGLEGIVEKYSKRNNRVTIIITIGGVEKRVDLEGKWLEPD